VQLGCGFSPEAAGVFTGRMAAVKEVNQMGTIAKVAVGVALGWLVEQVAADLLRQVGVPPHTAKVAGAVVGALV
jgi:hypothetical protein